MWVSVGVLGLATVVQIVQIARRKASAVVTGWFIWSQVNVVSWWAQKQAGSTTLELIVPLGQLMSTSLLFFVTVGVITSRGSWFKKATWDFGWGDLGAILCCAAGTYGMVRFDNPFVAIGCNVLANISGVVPMYQKGKKQPNKVTGFYWFLRGVSCCAAGALFMVPVINWAGLIPQFTGYVIACAMLWARIKGNRLAL